MSKDDILKRSGGLVGNYWKECRPQKTIRTHNLRKRGKKVGRIRLGGDNNPASSRDALGAADQAS